MSVFIYFIASRFYLLLILLSSLWNKKAALWIRGRKGLITRIRAEITDNKNLIWIHCSSLGEFESAKTLMETLKKWKAEKKILLTFFSPSGYEQEKEYKDADYVFYLPFDGPMLSKKFIDLIRPESAIFIKYDYWYFYLKHLHKRNIPVFIVAGVFHKDQIFFKSYGYLYRKMLSFIKHFFIQDHNSMELLHKIGFHNCEIIPDMRIDRVLQIKEEAVKKTFPFIEAFAGNEAILLAGSSYDTEEKFILQLLRDKIVQNKVILAPHNSDHNHIAKIKKLYGNLACCLSESKDQQALSSFQVLVIDSIGILKYLYKYAGIAIIGGGFNQGIHNTLEPAAYGIPVLFGPKDHEKFVEARELLKRKAAFLYSDYESLKKQIIELQKPTFREKCGQRMQAYINENKGGTKILLEKLFSE
jgi:3-deoxy-D-manno-octulosonic-acid transferase